METKKFGPNQPIKLTEPLDTWLSAGLRDFAVPEAAGSSARVFRLEYAPFAGDYADHPAIKVMRPDKRQYALPLFKNEIRILDLMRDVPGITPMLALGYMQVKEGAWPDEIAPLTTSLKEKASANQLQGLLDLYSPDETGDFLSELDARVADEWLAFIILPRRWEDNLYLRCDAGYTRGEFHRTFSVGDALQAAYQISHIIQAAHERGIVYLDHKVLHYFWNHPRQQVFALDWNIGRQVANGNNQEVYEFDLLQFSARALHHLMTGRQAPGSVNVGPNKPEDILNAPVKYEPVWTYDDQKRLTGEEMALLTKAIQGGYHTAQELAHDLLELYQTRQSNA
jgi:serine/threonine protein kinase